MKLFSAVRSTFNRAAAGIMVAASLGMATAPAANAYDNSPHPVVEYFAQDDFHQKAIEFYKGLVDMQEDPLMTSYDFGGEKNTNVEYALKQVQGLLRNNNEYMDEAIYEAWSEVVDSDAHSKVIAEAQKLAVDFINADDQYVPLIVERAIEWAKEPTQNDNAYMAHYVATKILRDKPHLVDSDKLSEIVINYMNAYSEMGAHEWEGHEYRALQIWPQAQLYPQLINDDTFAAWERLMDSDISDRMRYQAKEVAAFFVRENKDYLEPVLGRIEKDSEHSLGWRNVFSVIVRDYPEFNPRLMNVIEAEAEATGTIRTSYYIVEEIVKNDLTMKAQALDIVMADLRQPGDELSESLGMWGLGDILKYYEPGELGYDKANEIFEAILQSPSIYNDTTSIHVLNDLAKTEPEIAESVLTFLYDAFIRYNGENESSYDDVNEYKAAVIHVAGNIAASHPELSEMVMEIMVEGVTDENYRLASSAAINMARMGAALPEYAEQAYDAVKALESHPKQKFIEDQLMLALAYLAEKYEEYAQEVYDIALKKIDARGFTEGNALSVVGAMGHAHDFIRDQAFEALTDKIEGDKIDNDHSRIAMWALSDIANADQDAARKVLDYMREQARSGNDRVKYHIPIVAARIAYEQCDLLPEAYNTVKNDFMTQSQPDYIQQEAADVLSNMLENVGATIAECEERQADVEPVDTRVRTGFIYFGH